MFAHFFDFGDSFTLFKDEATIFSEKTDFADLFAQGVCKLTHVDSPHPQSVMVSLQSSNHLLFVFLAKFMFFSKKVPIDRSIHKWTISKK